MTESSSTLKGLAPRYQAYGLAILGGVLYFLGWAGFGFWPLSLVCLVPLWGALELGLEVEQPRKVRTPDFAESLRVLEADVAVVIAYGRILPRAAAANKPVERAWRARIDLVGGRG